MKITFADEQITYNFLARFILFITYHPYLFTLFIINILQSNTVLSEDSTTWKYFNNRKITDL